MGRLSNKRIIVAGGSGLIGSEICKAIEREGGEVINIDRKTGFDLLDSRLVDEIEHHYQFDGFVNASYPENFHSHMTIFLIWTEAACRRLAELGGGSVVNFSSIYGLVGTRPDIYPDTNIQMAPMDYSFVKAGIIGMSMDAATRYGSKGVRVNCIAPGGVFDGHGQGFVDNYSNRVPMGRMARPDDFSGLVVHLLSDESKYTTGQTIAVDGGLTAQ